MSDHPPESAVSIAEPLPTSTIIALGTAAATCGFAAGFLAGLTGTDATVITAIVSGLLAGIGSAAVAVGYFRLPHGTATQAAGLAVVLAVAIMFGVHNGISEYNESRIKTADDEFAAAAERHYQLLALCTHAQLEINTTRQIEKLDPLPADAFCPLEFPTPRARNYQVP